ncbi:MAG: MBL fold metallo-hydrolase [Candidatus Thermoplasmatota archaeon]|jgi:ribonuclease BN (tRNA processing enzyme)|nr:MBL fold metallo-hydrolase [Candidatus Thermoplasmatota archaeon]
MEYHHLPPPPDLRLFIKGDLKVASLYSIAGISSSFFVSSPEGTIIVDAGDGALRDMIELARLASVLEDGQGTPVNIRKADDLLGVLITHGHYDHCSGLLSLLSFQHLMGRTLPFIIAGPSGATLLWSLIDLFERTLWERCPYEIVRYELNGEADMDMGPFCVRHVENKHRESRPGAVGGPVHSMSYLVMHKDISVFFSGDCSDISTLAPFAKGASLAVVEATFPEAHPDQDGVHLTIEQAMALGSLAGEHWLVHLTAMSAKELSR